MHNIKSSSVDMKKNAENRVDCWTLANQSMNYYLKNTYMKIYHNKIRLLLP